MSIFQISILVNVYMYRLDASASALAAMLSHSHECNTPKDVGRSCGRLGGPK